MEDRKNKQKNSIYKEKKSNEEEITHSSEKTSSISDIEKLVDNLHITNDTDNQLKNTEDPSSSTTENIRNNTEDNNLGEVPPKVFHEESEEDIFIPEDSALSEKKIIETIDTFEASVEEHGERPPPFENQDGFSPEPEQKEQRKDIHTFRKSNHSIDLHHESSKSSPIEGSSWSKKRIAGVVGIIIVASVLVGASGMMFFLNSATASSPTADFYHSSLGLQVTFTDKSVSPVGNISSWYWEFDDGSASFIKNPVHTYNSTGTYQVSLTITDSTGLQDSVNKTIVLTQTEVDTDEDGYPDSADFIPNYDARAQFSFTKIKVLNETIETAGVNNSAEVYFEIWELFGYHESNETFNFSRGILSGRVPLGSDNISVIVGNMTNNSAGWKASFGIVDNIRTHVFNIRMYIVSGTNTTNDTSSLLDIDGTDETYGLTLKYDMVTERWIGDDEDGITSGADDGLADGNDCYIEYSITTVK